MRRASSPNDAPPSLPRCGWHGCPRQPASPHTWRRLLTHAPMWLRRLLVYLVALCAVVALPVVGASVVVVDAGAAASVPCRPTIEGELLAAACGSLSWAVGNTSAGDTVKVLPGRYTGAGSVNLELAGQLLMCTDSSPLSCVIDCEGVRGPAFNLRGAGAVGTSSTVDGISARRCIGALAGELRFGGAVRIGDGGGAVELSLRNLRLVENTASGSGGAVYAGSGAHIFLERVAVEGSSARNGGAVYLDHDSRAELWNSSVVNCSASVYGGAFYIRESATSRLNHVLVSMNTATFDGGGAIIFGSAALVSQNGSVISQNVAGDDGGGLIAVGSSVVTVEDTVFDSNVAADRGGACSAYNSASIVAVGAQFFWNRAQTAGAVYGQDDVHLSLTKTTMINNTAVAHGGAMSVWGSASLSATGIVALSNVGEDGGALSASDSSSVQCARCHMEANVALNSGGGFSVHDGASLSAVSSLLLDNIAGNDGGGGVCFDDATASFERVTISGNSAADRGGGLSNYGSATLTLHGGQISSNRAGNAGGGLYLETNARAFLDGVVLHSNTASVDGGAALLYGSAFLSISNVVISANDADDDGGGVYAAGSATVHCNNVTITLNTATDRGGGLFLTSAVSLSASALALTANHASNDGGGAHVEGEATVLLDRCTIANNAAVDRGGGIATYETSVLSIATSYMQSNSASRGGALYSEDFSQLTARFVNVSGNTALAEGGGYSAAEDASINIADGAVTFNSADWGGAVYLTGQASATLSRLVLAQSEARVGSGGCLRSRSGGELHVSHTTFSDCVAQQSGGGLALRGGSSALTELINVVVSGNTAATGGGVTLDDAGTIVVYASSIVRNTATGCAGSGVLCTGGTTLTSSALVVANNSGGCADAQVSCAESTCVFDSRSDTDVARQCGVAFSVVYVAADADTGVTCVAQSSEDPPSAPCGSIKQAVEVLGPGDEVRVAPGTYTGHQSTDIRLAGQSVVCSGVGKCVIDCEGIRGPAFDSYSPDLVGTTSVVDRISMKRCTGQLFNSNSGSFAKGGAVIVGNSGGVGSVGLVLRDLVISGSTARDGGGVGAFDGAVIVLDSVVVEDCASVYGGAVFLSDSAAVTATGVTLRHNTAALQGGAIFANLGPTVRMKACSVTDNAAADFGGAVAIFEGNAVFSGGTVLSRNTANVGGAIFASGTASASLTDTFVQGNVAVMLGGGAVVTGRAAAVVSGSSAFADNAVISPSGAGGALMLSSDASIALHDTLVLNHTAHLGGAVYISGNAVLSSTGSARFALNRAFSGGAIYAIGSARVTLNGPSVLSNRASGSGGGVAVHESATLLCLEGTELKFNSAVNNGGGLVSMENSIVQMVNTTVSCNSAEGGAGMDVRDESTCEASRSDFSLNVASFNGGGVLVRGRSQFVMHGGVVESNEAGGNGGALQVEDSARVQFFGAECHRNAAGVSGGAISAEGTADFTADGSSVFSFNSAVDFGGAIFAVGDSTSTMRGAVLDSNFATYGGAVVVGGRARTFILNDTLLAHNEAASTAGAVLVADTAFCVFDGATLHANTATTSSGGLQCQGDSSVQLRHSIVDGNTAGSNGGAMSVVRNAHTEVHNVTFSANTAQVGGAAFIINAASVTMTDTALIGNRVAAIGGALYSSSTGLIDLRDVEMRDCSANVSAGAAYFDGGPSAVTRLEAVRIHANKAQEAGALMFGNAGTVTAVSVTVENNVATCSGGGVLCEGATTLTSTEMSVVGNTAGSLGTQVMCRSAACQFDSGGTSGINLQCAASAIEEVYTVPRANTTDYSEDGEVVCCGSQSNPCRGLGRALDERGSVGALLLAAGEYTASLILADGDNYDIDIRAEDGVTWRAPSDSASVLQVGDGSSVSLSGISIFARPFHSADINEVDSGGRVLECNGGTASLSLSNVAVTGPTSGLLRAKRGCSLHMTDSHLLVADERPATDPAVPPFGGCVEVGSGSKASLTRCSCRGGRALTAGGCVSVIGANVDISDSAFVACASGRAGGALSVSNGGLLALRRTVVEASVSRFGGCIHVQDAVAFIDDSSQLVGCVAAGDGGGIGILNSQVNLSSSAIHDCSSGGSGGAVAVTTSQSSSRFPLSEPVATLFSVENCSVKSNRAAVAGGGFAAIGDPNSGTVFAVSGIRVDVHATHLINNTAGVGGGGAVLLEGGGALITVSESVVRDNRVSDGANGGAFHVPSVAFATHHSAHPVGSAAAVVDVASVTSHNSAPGGVGGGWFVGGAATGLHRVASNTNLNCAAFGADVFLATQLGAVTDSRQISTSAAVLHLATVSDGHVRLLDPADVQAHIAAGSDATVRGVRLVEDGVDVGELSVVLTDATRKAAPLPSAGTVATVELAASSVGSDVARAGASRASFETIVSSNSLDSACALSPSETSLLANRVSLPALVASFRGLSLRAPARSTVSLSVELVSNSDTAVQPVLLDVRVGGCAPGSEAVGTACVECAVGRYRSPDDGDESCDTCPAGSDAPREGMTACQPCAVGTSRGEGDGLLCAPCPAGTYRGDDNAPTECLPCPTNSIAAGEGMTSCSPCPLGEVAVGGTSCEACDVGRFRGPHDTDCHVCESGRIASEPGSSVCTSCPVGTQAVGGAACEACGAGTYRGEDDTECRPCEAGTIAAEDGSRSCAACPPGRHAVGGTTCELCAAGTYRSENRGPSCLPCAIGTVSLEDGSAQCTPCPIGHQAVGAAACSMCPSLTYANSNHTDCVECPREGVSCSQGVITLIEGYWIAGNVSLDSITAQTTLYACPEDACVLDSDGRAVCAEGRSGALCATCLPNHFSEGTSCLPCASDGLNWTLLVLLIMFLFAATVIMIQRTLAAGKREAELATSTSRPSMMMPTIRILLNYLQVASFLVDFEIPWPDSLSSLWSASGSASTLPVTAGFVTCTLEMGYYSRFWLAAMSPFVASLVLLVIPMWQRYRGADHRVQWTTYSTAVLVVAYLLYPTVARDVLRMFACSGEIDGVSYLEADFRVHCGTATHTLHVVVAVIVLLAFALGLPAYTAWALRRAFVEGTLQATHTRKRLLFLYESYRPKRAWWESCVMMRKLLLVAVAATLGDGTHGHQTVSGALVLLAAFCLQLALRPYAWRQQSRLENLSLATSLSSMLVGQFFLLGGLTEAASGFLAWTLITLNVGFVLCCLAVIFGDARKNVRSTLESVGLGRFVTARGAGGSSVGAVELAAIVGAQESDDPTAQRMVANPMLSANRADNHRVDRVGLMQTARRSSVPARVRGDVAAAEPATA